MDGEVSAAIDPSQPDILLAGSIGKNDEEMRFYGSADGGTLWRSGVVAPPLLNACYADPAVAIAIDGREYYAYLRGLCTEEAGRLFVRTRSGVTDAWSRPYPIDPPTSQLTQDRPAIAVDANPKSPHEGRVWIAWSDYAHEHWDGAFVAYSDDGGFHWSHDQQVDAGGYEPTLSVAPDGRLIEASVNVSEESVYVSSPGPGGFQHRFDATASTKRWCSKTHLLPAQPHRHVCATPSIAIDDTRNMVYVAWSGNTRKGTRGVFVRRLSLTELAARHVSRPLPAPIDTAEAGKADEFFPTATVDQSDGALWVCFYETLGESRIPTRFTCRVSRDGAQTWVAVPAAARTSNEAGEFASPFGYGDYEDVVAADGVSHPFWTAEASLELSDDIFTARLAQP